MAYQTQPYPAYQFPNLAFIMYTYNQGPMGSNAERFTGPEMFHHSGMHTLKNWDAEKNKDKEEYYADPQFRWDYMVHKMPSKVQDCESLIRDQVKNLIYTAPRDTVSIECNGGMFFYRHQPGTTLRILSLGCGPGTDLVAVICACVSIGGVQRIECCGVDRYPWPLDAFRAGLKELQRNFASGVEVLTSFVLCDSAQFVNNCIFAGQKFDLVISCYARARDKCQLFGHSVPQVLSQFGRIFVIDNNSQDLQHGLTAMGFQIVRKRIGGKLIFLAL